GLGIPAGGLDRPVPGLSGGERRRVELARVLLSQAGTLLLDEPTNHLDADAKRWLAGVLADFTGGILLVSHDLPLLDRDVTGVLVLDPMTASIETYKGTWTQYLEASEVRARSEARQRKILERDIKRLSTFVEKYRHSNEDMARRAMVTERRVEKMRQRLTPERKSGRKVAVKFPDPPPSGRFPLDGVDLSRSYGGPPGFKPGPFPPQGGGGPPCPAPRGARRCSSTSPSTSSGASGCWCWASTGPARPRCCASWPASIPPTRARSAWATAPRSATTPRSTRASTPTPPPWSRCARSPRPPTTCSGASSATSCSAATRPTSRPGPSRGARRPSSPWPAWSSAATTSCSSTSPPTTWTSRRSRPSARPWRPSRDRWSWSATTPRSCRASSPIGSSSCPTAPWMFGPRTT